MVYSKHFYNDGVTVIFDKLELVEFPNLFIATKDGYSNPTVFIEKNRFKFKGITTLAENLKIVTFGY